MNHNCDWGLSRRNTDSVVNRKNIRVANSHAGCGLAPIVGFIYDGTFLNMGLTNVRQTGIFCLALKSDALVWYGMKNNALIFLSSAKYDAIKLII